MLRQMIDDLTECNKFEIKIKDNKVTFYYYDKIKHFSSTSVVISSANKDVIISGNNLIIEQLFLEYVTISGNITKMEFKNNEK